MRVVNFLANWLLKLTSLNLSNIYFFSKLNFLMVQTLKSIALLFDHLSHLRAFKLITLFNFSANSLQKLLVLRLQVQ